MGTGAWLLYYKCEFDPAERVKCFVYDPILAAGSEGHTA